MTLSYEDERTLQSLAGRAAVQDLTIRQHRALEAGGRDDVVGHVRRRGRPRAAGSGSHRRAPGTAALVRQRATSGQRAAGRSVVRIDGVHGTQECRTLVSGDDGNVSLASVVPVADEVIYERGRWYFARRRVGSAQ